MHQLLFLNLLWDCLEKDLKVGGVKSGGGHGPELCVWLMDMFEATRLKMVFTALT